MLPWILTYPPLTLTQQQQPTATKTVRHASTPLCATLSDKTAGITKIRHAVPRQNILPLTSYFRGSAHCALRKCLLRMRHGIIFQNISRWNRPLASGELAFNGCLYISYSLTKAHIQYSLTCGLLLDFFCIIVKGVPFPCAC